MIFEIKKYGLTFYNLRCQYCGTDKFVWKFWLQLCLLIFGELRCQCDYCMKFSRYILNSHVVHDADKQEHIMNKDIEDHKRRTWVK